MGSASFLCGVPPEPADREKIWPHAFFILRSGFRRAGCFRAFPVGCTHPMFGRPAETRFGPSVKWVLDKKHGAFSCIWAETILDSSAQRAGRTPLLGRPVISLRSKRYLPGIRLTVTTETQLFAHAPMRLAPLTASKNSGASNKQSPRCKKLQNAIALLSLPLVQMHIHLRERDIQPLRPEHLIHPLIHIEIDTPVLRRIHPGPHHDIHRTVRQRR